MAEFEEEVTGEEIPVEETPEETTTEETPVEDAPVEETPIEETPVDESIEDEVPEDETIPPANEEEETPPSDETEQPPVKTEEELAEEERQEEIATMAEMIESWETVDEIISMDAPFEDKLEAISKSNFTAASLLVAMMNDYARDFKGYVEPKIGAARTNRVYQAIMGVIREKDEAVFRAKFNLINLFFLTYGKEGGAFNPIMLNRYTIEQGDSLSTKEVNTFHIITALISTLADASTRNKEKSSVGGFSASTATVLTDDNVSRVKEYYGMD